MHPLNCNHNQSLKCGIKLQATWQILKFKNILPFNFILA